MSWFRYFSLALAAASAVAATGKTYDVTVGKDGKLLFDPEHITASVGDLVTYHFFPKNHSVTQSSFDEPCKPLDGGFFSGFVPTQDLANAAATTFTVEVKDTKPIWVYCSQTAGNHCQSGMIHAINAPTSGNTIDAFREKAKGAPTSTSPEGGLPKGGVRKTQVEVGPGGQLKFVPNNLTALVGEYIQFNFNPKAHGVVQSNFDNPCQPLSSGGFSSGLVPVQVSPSGASFEIEIKDTKPVWFYCPQTNGNHCQSGMVGSVNAPLSGNTLEAFTELAKNAPTSTLPDGSPLLGTLNINGTITGVAPPNGDNNNNAPPKDNAPPNGGKVPPPGEQIPADVANMAGGYQPASYNWAPKLSDKATLLLQLLNWCDNVLVEALYTGHANLTTGGWKNLYPESITHTVGSMSAQAIVHRSTSTDSLIHYEKPVMGMCKYKFPISSVEDFSKVGLKLTLLEIALILDIIASVVDSDPWLIPCLASTLGSKARMAGMINMMQNHIPAAAPREAMLPAEYVYSYVHNNYVVEGSCGTTPKYDAFKPLSITSPPPSGNERLTVVSVAIEAGQGDLWMAWVGAWGKVWFTPIRRTSQGQGSADVPGELSGHVWGILTNKKDVPLKDLPKWTVAGPEMVWVTQP